MATTPSLTAVLTAILNGEFDGDERAIYDAFKTRRGVAAQIAAASYKPGDRVRFTDAVRPKYLIGVEANVVKVNAKTVVVKMDSVQGRFGGETRCPAELIEAV